MVHPQSGGPSHTGIGGPEQGFGFFAHEAGHSLTIVLNQHAGGTIAHVDFFFGFVKHSLSIAKPTRT